MLRSELPIDAVLPGLTAALRQHNSLVVQAPAGAGKTTRVPPGLLRAGISGERKIVVLQPRRLAARATAARMADENGWQLGQEVGYQVRFEQQISRATRIAVVTEGILLRQLRQDPFLQDTAVVMFDEFHERNLASELALGMVRQVQQAVRPELKIVVMSATLAAAPIAKYLNDCPIVEGQGRTYPVEISYLNPAQRRTIPELAADGLRQVLACTPGDVLVFLPGLREIRQTRKLAEDLTRGCEADLLELYGDLPAEQQAAVLGRRNRRKVILSTNVAETSVTIDGVTAVVDSGWERQLRFDPRVGLDRLELTPISLASADQRAGRAGRTAPGICLRLWDERSHGSRPAYVEAEIRRVDLAGAVLQLLGWIEPDLSRFPWYEVPREESLSQTMRLLKRLEAVDEAGITPLGRRIAELPAHPRLGRLLVEAERLGCVHQAVLAAALLSERDPFIAARRTDGRRQAATYGSRSDVADRVHALEEWEPSRGGESPSGTVNRQAARQIFRVRDQLLRQLAAVREGDAPAEPRQTVEVREGDAPAELRQTAGTASPRLGGSLALPDTAIGTGPCPTARQEPRPPKDARQEDARQEPRPPKIARPAADPDEALSRCLLAAFPDRLAKRREPGSRRGVMVGGRGVRLADESAVGEGGLFLCVDVDGAGAEALVRQAAAVEREWLPDEHLTEQLDIFFDEATERLAARRRRFWEDLLLDEAPTALPHADQATRVLTQAAANRWDRVFPADEPAVAGFLARVRCLSRWLPELNLPGLEDAALRELLPSLCAGRRSFAELRSSPWLAMLKSLLSREQLQAVEQFAPERVLVPSGRSVALQYREGQPPILAARIQELFGLAETPRIARGRVPVLLHLLAPNQRVQQVTDDLQSFWDNVYPRVRKDLRGRYPKHAWPADPWQAKPEKK
ncbi:MAG: helicase-related protein [Planctomycetota bacterium]|nr:helicase-related protein [Planctomycetota bacterium]